MLERGDEWPQFHCLHLLWDVPTQRGTAMVRSDRTTEISVNSAQLQETVHHVVIHQMKV